MVLGIGKTPPSLLEKTIKSRFFWTASLKFNGMFYWEAFGWSIFLYMFQQLIDWIAENASKLSSTTHLYKKKRRFKVGRWGPRWHKNISSNMCSIFFFFTNLCHFCNCTLKLRALESVWQTDTGQHWKEIELTKGQRLLLKSISQSSCTARQRIDERSIHQREREREMIGDDVEMARSILDNSCCGRNERPVESIGQL